jgi:replicative DNA helicase
MTDKDKKKEDLTGPKSFPYDSFAESVVLANILLDTKDHANVFSRVTSPMFYVQPHKIIYTKCLILYDLEESININSLLDKLGKTKLLTDVSNLDFLLDFLNVETQLTDFNTCVIILIEKSYRRSLMQTVKKIGNLALDLDMPLEKLLDTSENTLLELTQRNATSGLLLLQEILLESFLTLGEDVLNSISGVKTGFSKLDDLTQGFQASDLIIIAGRPSMGKTAFALNIAMNICSSQKELFPVCIFSLEMSRQQVVNRMLSTLSGITSSDIRSGKIDSKKSTIMEQSLADLNRFPIYVDDSGTASIPEIRSKLIKMKLKYKQIDMVIIDYLQLLGSDSKDTRTNEISKITRSLKLLAKELQTPIVLLSQLNRAVETQTNKRPMLSHLRDSGSVEQDSDLVLFLYRESYYNPGNDDETEIILAKHRNGPTGVVRLAFESSTATFKNMEY